MLHGSIENVASDVEGLVLPTYQYIGDSDFFSPEQTMLISLIRK